MNILFMGTPEFAVPSLKRLYENGHTIVGVYTQPDKPKNRGHKLTFSPVKEYAVSVGLPVYQPLGWKDPAVVEEACSLGADLIVVAAYGRILPESVLHAPKFRSINVHSSLLPKYRGAAPINWAIINGEETTGVSIMYMEQKLDAGDVILSKETKIGTEETALELTARLAEIGADALIEAISLIENGTVSAIPQDEERQTYAPMLDRSLSPIDWTLSSKAIDCKVRGLIPWPCASAVLNGVSMKVYKTTPGKETSAEGGTVLSAGKQGIEVACGDGKSIFITEMQAEGGKRMSAAAYLLGHPMSL